MNSHKGLQYATQHINQSNTTIKILVSPTLWVTVKKPNKAKAICYLAKNQPKKELKILCINSLPRHNNAA